VEALGEHSYVHLDQPGGTVLIAKAPGDAQFAPGDTAQFRAHAAQCHLFAQDGFAVAPLAAQSLESAAQRA
jgi:multiple sugar transport system ATP-binding protein